MYYSFCLDTTKARISNADKAPIAKMDKKSTLRIVAALEEIVKKLTILKANKMDTITKLRFRFFIDSIFSFLMILISGYIQVPVLSSIQGL